MRSRQTSLRFGTLTFLALLAAAAVLESIPLHAQAGSAHTPLLGVDTLGFDRGIRPQDDFYRYVNGGWMRETVIPDDRTSLGTFTELADRSETALAELVQAAEAGTHGDADSRRIGALYRSFLDTLRVESLGAAPVSPELDRIAGIADRAGVAAELGRLASLGITPLFGFYVSADPGDSRMNALSLSQGSLGLGDRDLYFEAGERFEEIRLAYQEYIGDLLGLVGSADPAGAAERILDLEHALAAAHWTRTQNRDRNATYNPTAAAELAQRAPNLDWTTYFREAGFSPSAELILRQPDFIPAMDAVFAATPVSTWREYLTFRLLDEAAPYLSSSFVDARFAFRGRVLQGMQGNRERWRRGLTLVEQALGEPLGRLYVERHFDPEARVRMERLVENLLAAFAEGIDELEWMSEATRQEAHEKLARITVKIGHPDVWYDYSGLEIRPDDLYGNWERSRRFDYRRMIDQLGEPVDRNEWFMTPQTVNAYYSPANNEIVFPAAILQPPFFDPRADDAVNYGAIGAVIGHEISHGFDDQGRKSDGEGNLRDWWTDEDAAAFEARASRLAEQFSDFSPLEGMTLNGRLSLGENIGDLSGITVAYRAYRRSLGGSEAPEIGGFSGDQRFFLGWAQIWRTLYREEALRQLVVTGPHAPGEFRVNGIVRNLRAFLEAFEVAPGDGMYRSPEEQVRIW